MKILCILILSSVFICCSDADKNTICITNLACEYIQNPSGIETATPRLAWEMISDMNGEVQTAYHILVSNSEAELTKNQGNMWDSGKITSTQNNNVAYAGKTLETGKRYYWKVKVWNVKNQEQKWSNTAWFEMGLLSASDWQNAKWIGLTTDLQPAEHASRSIQTRNMKAPKLVSSHPAPLIRNGFNIHKTITSARAYVSGLGYNEFYINGKLMGNAVLRPGQTSYNKRAYYEIYDIDSALNSGQNTIAFMLGNGFYGQNLAFGVASLQYGQPRLKCLLSITYDDGSIENIVSDTTWLCTTGPIVFDNVYAGETYDARLEVKNWNKNECDLSGWSNANELDNKNAPVLTAQLLEPIRKIKYIQPTNFYKTKHESVIYDCGQNIAGWAKIRVNEPSGTKITLRYVEILSKDRQEIDPVTTGTPATGFVQTDVYICKGGDEEVWEPRFTYHGFRYIEVEGLSKPQANTLELCFVRNDVKNIGSFSCSDSLLNEIYSTSLRTIESNLHNTPEDCPHREKCGWIGDAHTSVEVMNYNYNMRRMWIKFMNDVESNLGTGQITYEGIKATPGIPTNIALGRRVCQEARPDWGAAVILIPWNNYVFYGNTQILSDHFPLMQRWMNYLKAYLKDNILYQGYGDWCHVGWSGRDSIPTPTELTSTAYYYHSLQLMSKISEVLNKPELAKTYLHEAPSIKEAFNTKFLNLELLTYGTQTANAIALDMRLVPDGKEKEIAASLAKLEVEQKKDGHFFTGVHGTKRLFTQLAEYGYEDLVFKMLQNEDYPSFKYLLNNNFTTWPESFQNYDDDEQYRKGSHNHQMNSAFAMWYHQNAGGIKPDETKPGFKHFTIKPFGYHHLAFVNASYQSNYGQIISNWKVERTQFLHSINIPVNSTATVYVPTSNKKLVTIIQLQSGTESNIVFKTYENGFAVYELASGKYEIKSVL